MKRIYTAFSDDGGELLVIPSSTPNPMQKRTGIRINGVTAWLRDDTMKELAKQLLREVKS